MSPGINDPGTAIDVIGRQERLLWDYARADVPDDPPAYARIFSPPLKARTLVENAFAMLARDGAGNIEVVRRLLRALEALEESPDADLVQACRNMAGQVRAYATAALPLELERESLLGDAETRIGR